MEGHPLKTENKYFPILMLFVVVLLWSATFVIVKEALADSSSMLFIAVRFSIASVLLVPYLIYKRAWFIKEELLPGLILGVILFGGFATQTVGLKFTTATKSGFLTGTSVVMIPIIQTVLERRKPSKGAVIGSLMIFVGILFMSSGGDSIFTFLEKLGENFNVGDTLTLICAFLFALYIVYLDYVSHENDFLQLLFLQLAVSAALGFVASYLFESVGIEIVKFDLTGNLMFALIYTSVFATLITTALMTKYQKFVSPTKAGIIYSFEPVFAAFIAFFAINEKITMFGFIGSLLIFSGLIIAEFLEGIMKRYE